MGTPVTRLQNERHVYTATMPDGSELMVERYVDGNGHEVALFVATRPKPEAQIVWGPPTRLVKR